MTDNKKMLIREAYRRSEERLAAQQLIALAADTRALTFSGLLFAGAAILIGQAGPGAFGAAAGVTSVMLVVAAAVAGWSAMPVGFWVPGGEYRLLASDIENDTAELDVLIQVGGFNDKHIDENNRIMDRNGMLMRIAFVIAVIAPFAGLAIWNCFLTG